MLGKGGGVNMDSKKKSFDDLAKEIRDLWDRADQIREEAPDKARELTLQAHELVEELDSLDLSEQ